MTLPSCLVPCPFSAGTAEAEFHFREVLRLNPLQGDARVNLSGLLLKAGKLGEACKVGSVVPS